MVTDKIKQYIFKRLYKELGNAEIIPYNNSIWFIDREERYWYFELENNGNLYWRYTFFNNFFKIFSMKSNQFEPIISEWVEEVLNHKVSKTKNNKIPSIFWLEEVLNHKVSKTTRITCSTPWRVEEVLNHKVSKTECGGFTHGTNVEEVLNHKVSTTHLSLHNLHDLVEDVLNENPTE